MVVKFNKMNEVATYLVDLESGPLSIPVSDKIHSEVSFQMNIASRTVTLRCLMEII